MAATYKPELQFRATPPSPPIPTPFGSIPAWAVGKMDDHEVTKKKEWDLVIKVKYGDTLRRFVISVHSCLANYNMSDLREKIISLFKLHCDANLIITYIDGDNDVRTLENDDELRDAAIIQRLNPLRINVQLKTNANCDPQSEIGSSTSALANLVPCFAKIGFTDADQSSRAVASGFPGQSSGASRNLMDLKAIAAPKASIGPVSTTITLSNTNSGIRFLEDTSTNYGSVNRTNHPQGTAPMSVDPNLDPSKNLHEQNKTSASPSDKATCHSSNNYAAPNLAKGATEAQIHMHNKTAVHLPKDPKPSSLHLPTRCRRTPSYHDSMFRITHKNVQCDGCGMYPIMGPRYKSKVKQDYDLCQLCFLEMGNDTDYKKLEKDDGPDSTRMDHACITHKNVHCDGCGMYPIKGPRYKSEVKYDYDLCDSCFLEMGNEADYTKIENDNGPNNTRVDNAGHRFLGRTRELRYSNPSCAPDCRTSQLWVNGDKLNSLFIQDICVLDGTKMPPCTLFTKIWRIRNNGSTAWSIGTQLMWIFGANFGHPGCIPLKIPANGCPVNGEIDVAVDFISPCAPGSYLSYWQMVSPSGQKFGQCIWFQILVKNPLAGFARGKSHANFNLNMLPETIELEPLVDPTPNMDMTPVAMDELPNANKGLAQPLPLKQTSVDTYSKQIDLNIGGCRRG